MSPRVPTPIFHPVLVEHEAAADVIHVAGNSDSEPAAFLSSNA
jgi:hypothetical protein